MASVATKQLATSISEPVGHSHNSYNIAHVTLYNLKFHSDVLWHEIGKP